MRLPVLIALLAGLCAATAATGARAETFNTCKGFITAVPATISTQGTWCLSQDIATAITSGAAIEIATNNVTIDCNNFKLGGLAAGTASLAVGIHAVNRRNVTVRNCTVRGFHSGIFFEGARASTSGHLVEDNRLDNNLQTAIHVKGDGSTVRGNFMFDTGGAVGQTAAHGLITSYDVDILDNTIADVQSLVDPYGMAVLDNYGGLVANNRIRGLFSVNGYYSRIGIFANANTHATVRDNTVVMYGNTLQSTGLYCMGAGSGTHIRDNRVYGFGTVHTGCLDEGGN